MLLEFRVKNFKSIRDEQVLSMIANKDKSHEESHVADLGNGLRVLKSAVIYGANASGKSNLIDALFFMKLRVQINSFYANRPSVCPRFRLDAGSKNSSSEFEVTYMNEGIRYQYGFSLLGNRVGEEWLLVYKSDKPQEWFRRSVDTETGEDVYRFSSYFKGQKRTWQASTRVDALFLSTAVELNSEQLRPVYNWFLVNMGIFQSEPFPQSADLLRLLANEDYKKGILSFLSTADLGIRDVNILVEKKAIPSFHPRKDNGDQESLAVEEGTVKEKVLVPVFSHMMEDGGVELFELNDESHGTQRLFELSFHMLNSVKIGGAMIIDELESALHPLLIRHIISLFNSTQNVNGAQLIFSTHDAGLLDTEIFRRDQIWFVEKDASQATVLYPLTDFSPRKNEALESGYLSGRYGAIPFLSDFDIDRLIGDGA